MAQTNTTIPTKSVGDQLTSAEFNELNSVVNTNSADAEPRLTSIETTNASIDSRLTAVETLPNTVPSFENANLPQTAANGSVAYDTDNGIIAYHKDGAWYKFSDNSEDIFVVIGDGLVFSVKTDNPGTSSSTSFTLPLINGQTYNFVVKWGDGVEETITSDAELTHDYGTAGTYNVIITGSISGIIFNGGGDADKMVEITDMTGLTYPADGTGAFLGCNNLVFASGLTPADTSSTNDFQWFFKDCDAMVTPPLIDTSNGIAFFGMFRDCESVLTMPAYDFTGVPASGNTNPFRDAFRGMTSITSFDAVTWGDVGTDLRTMFHSCGNLLTVPSFDTSRVTAMRDTFMNCTSIVTFPFKSTGNITTFENAWFGCSSLTNFPLLDLSSGTNFAKSWQLCALNSASIDNILAALVANGTAGLQTNLSGGSTIPESSFSTQAQADIATLRANGWTVQTN
jgi:surface protein